MPKILIVTGFWPPKIHVAANRAIAFAKYFKQSGFAVTILTLQDVDSVNTKQEEVDTAGIRVIRLNGEHALRRERMDGKKSFADRI